MRTVNKGTQVVMPDRQEEERINYFIDKYTQSEQEQSDVKEKSTQIEHKLLSTQDKHVSNIDLSVQIADLRRDILSMKQKMLQQNQPSIHKKEPLKRKMRTKKCKRKIRKKLRRKSRCESYSVRNTCHFDAHFMNDLYQKYLISRKIKERKNSLNESDILPQYRKEDYTLSHKQMDSPGNGILGINPMQTQSNKMESSTLNRFKEDFTMPYKRMTYDILGLKDIPARTYSNKMDIWPSEVNVNPPRSLDQYFRTSLQHEAQSSVQQPSRSMNLEILRLETFRNFPMASEARPIRLAKAGFFYTGNEDRVECYSCGIIYRNWRNDEDPSEVHRRISPLCQHVQNQDQNNVPIHGENPTPFARTSHVDQTSTSSESSRQVTNGIANSQANSSTGMSNIDSNDLPMSSSDNQGQRQIGLQTAANGNSRTSTSNTHSTVSATMEVSSSQGTHVVQNHARDEASNSRQTNRAMSTQSNENGQNQASGSNGNRQLSTRDAMLQKLNPLGITFDKPRYPAYAVLTVRISSFQNWPPNKTQTPKALAYAGFLYAGYADYVRCFFCGGGLRNWEDGDDPWMEHARWFPRCTFLRQNKGDEFVALVQEQHLKEQNPSTETRSNENGDRNKEMRATGHIKDPHERFMDSEAVKSVLEMGYTDTQISDALKRRNLQTTEKPELSAHGILDILLEEEANMGHSMEASAVYRSEPLTDPSNETKSLMEENLRLKDQRLCKVCLDKEANIAMLPCGHLCCCPECAPAMRKCPICRAFVKGTVRTWLA